jgi:regulator of replication initiation timing
MSTINRKEISEALVEALNKENIHTREAARLLNLNPVYVSMAKNPNSWDHLGITAWTRLEDWLFTRGPLSEYKIPEGEEIYKPKERPVSQQAPATSDTEDISNIQHAGALGIKKEDLRSSLVKEHKINEPKSVKIILQKAEIENLNSRIDDLQKGTKEINLNNTLLLAENNKLRADLEVVNKKLFVLEDETIAVMLRRIKNLEEGREHLVTIPKADNKPGLVIFQRNIYKS